MPWWHNFVRFKALKKEKSFVKKLKKILDKKGFIPFIIMVAWLVAVSVKIKGKVLPSSLLFLDL